MRRGVIVAGLMLFAGLLLAAQACTGSSAATPAASTAPALTLSTARQAFNTFVTADDIARASGDEWLEVSLVANGEVALTTAAYQDAAFLGQRVPRYRYGTPRLYVPRLKGYPFWFMGWCRAPRWAAGPPAPRSWFSTGR